MADKTEQDLSDQALRDKVVKRFDEAQSFRNTMERTWYVCLCFFFGRQWITWDEGAYTIREMRLNKKKFYSTSNRIFPTIRQLVAKLARQKLALVATPTKSDEAATANAQVANKVFYHVLENSGIASNKANTNAYEIYLSVLLYSKCYMKDCWDPNKGELIDVSETRTGDISIFPVIPFYFYLDPLASTVYDARYAFYVSIRSRQYVQETYDVSPGEIPVAKSLPSMIMRVEDFFDRTEKTRKDAVVVKEYWEPKSKENPEGKHIVLANDKMVFNGTNEYGWIPFVEFNYFPKMGQQNSINLTEQLIYLQREYNRLRSDIIEWEKIMMRGKWLVPTNSLVNESAITDQTGEKLTYDPRYGAPSAISGTPPPNEIWVHIERVKQEFDEISGVREVSRGKVPSGLRSSQAIMFLQEQDDSNLAPTYAILSDSYSILGQRIIEIAAKYYKEDRLLLITGKNLEPEVVQFKKGSLSAENLSIRSEIGSKIPYSYFARQQFVMQLAQYGLISDKNKLLKMLELPTEDELFQENKYDEINANEENSQMTKSVNVVAWDYDNHKLHLEIHNNFRKKPENRKLDKEVQKIMLDHVLIHQQHIANAMKAQAEAMAGQPQKKGGAKHGADS